MPLAVRESIRHTGPRALDALHRHPLCWALVLAAVVTALLLVALTPRFETNDDIAMQSVVDGSLTGEPQPDLIFTNVIVGLVLAGLYRAAEGFPWYAACLYLLQFAALTALIYVVLAGRREGLAGRLLLLGGVVAVFHLPLWLGLQFTSTALLLGATGVVLFRSVADRVRFPWTPVVGAAAMVGVSWWLRWRSGAAAVLLGAVILAPALRRANWRRFAAFAGIVLVFLAVGWVTQAAYYGARPDWQDYFAFNKVRGGLHASHDLLNVDQAVLDEVGWTRNDLLMFHNWFLGDEATYRTDDLEVIAAAVPHHFEVNEGLTLLRRQVAGRTGGLRVALVATLGGLAFVQGDHRRRWTITLGALATVGAALFFAATTKLPNRVALPLLALLAVLFVGALGGPDRSAAATRGRYRAVWRAAAAALAAFALVVGAHGAVVASRSNDAKAAARRGFLATLERFDPAGVFVVWGGEVPRWAAPLSQLSVNGDGEPHLVPLGWMQQSPTAAAVLVRYGMDDVYTAIARGEAYLPLHRLALGSLYLTYLDEHYGFSGLLVPVGKVSRLTIFKGVAAFALDGAAGLLVETRFDGSTTGYPLAGPGPGDAATATKLAGSSDLVIEGRAAADLIVVVHGQAAVALALPLPAGNGVSRFQVTLTHPPANLRIFALGDGLAREITPTLVTP